MSSCAICHKKIGFRDKNKIFGDIRICDDCLKKIKFTDFGYYLSNIPKTENKLAEIITAKLTTEKALAEQQISDPIKSLVMSYYDDVLDVFYDGASIKKDDELENRIRAQFNNQIEKEKQYLKQKSFMTTGDSFETYTITEYLGIITSEITLGTGMFSSVESNLADLTGSESKLYTKKLKDTKEKVLDNLFDEAINRGGNAIIGIRVDFESFTHDLIAVNAIGTCVKIKQINDN